MYYSLLFICPLHPRHWELWLMLHRSTPPKCYDSEIRNTIPEAWSCAPVLPLLVWITSICGHVWTYNQHRGHR